MNEQKSQAGPLPRDLLAGKTAIVTGGSRGIGQATALRLAEAGANVVVNYHSNEVVAEEVVRNARELGVDAFALQGDVSKVEAADVLVDRTIERFGRLDILVANAGIWQGSPVELMSEETWDRVIDINLKGTWTVCRAAAKVMKQQGRGTIVIVSSTAGQRGEAGYSNYAASKGGQISFTKALATELAPDIRVNCVAPGWVYTPLNDTVFSDEDYERKIIEGIPLNRIASADDIALPIVFLTSDWARHITGEVVNVNGGAVLCG
jgi:3-oxoacyl-[acyl-carrier protein] reductase